MHRKIAFAIAAGIYALCGMSAGFAKDVGGDEKVVVQPAQGKVGTRFNVLCKNFPEPTSRDLVYIVAAGTPDVDPMSAEGQQEKILWKDYAVNCFHTGRFLFPAGPFAPGTYEVRFVTTLYNNDQRGEIATRSTFTVTR